MSHQAHKMKPQLAFHRNIDGLRSLQQFSKKNYKSLSKLKIIKTSNQQIKFRKFKQVSSSLKNVRHFDLSSFRPQNFKASQFKLFLKKFYKIQQFSNPCTKKTSKGLIYVSFLLHHGQYLKDLYLQAAFKDLTRRFLFQMSLCKIRTLHFTQINPDKDKPEMVKALFDSCPSTIENLSLFWGWRQTIQKKSLNLRLPSSLKNLQKLELGVKLALEDFKDILKSIPDPSKLKSLQFNITQEQMEPRGSLELGEFLTKFTNLEELNMITGVYTMRNFYSGISNLKLKKLDIDQVYTTDDDLLKLEDLIQRQGNSLETLRLRIMIAMRKSYCFEKFFGNIKLLKKLQKLDLRLLPLKTYFVILPTYKPLTEIVKALEGLEEINFEIHVDFEKKSFEDFCKILSQKHSKTLKSLGLSLKGCLCSDPLAQTLKRLPKLKDLTLRNLIIEEGSNFYNELRDLVCYKNLGLNSVIITETKTAYRLEQRESFIKMLQEIICKSTMENFSYLVENWLLWGTESGFENLSGVLNHSDILKQIYHFKFLQFPSYTCRPELDPRNLENYKWSE